MPVCCIKQCGARKSNKRPTLTLHRFPVNEVLRKKWLDIIGIENINTRHKMLFVCSLHFSETSINNTLNVSRLRDGALLVSSLPLPKDRIIELQNYVTDKLPVDKFGSMVGCQRNSNAITSQRDIIKRVNFTKSLSMNLAMASEAPSSDKFNQKMKKNINRKRKRAPSKLFNKRKKVRKDNEDVKNSLKQDLNIEEDTAREDCVDVSDETGFSSKSEVFIEECARLLGKRNSNTTTSNNNYNLPQASNIIYNVYKYLSEEYNTIKSCLSQNVLDALTDVVGRTASATGVSRETVNKIIVMNKGNLPYDIESDHNYCIMSQNTLREENTEDFGKPEVNLDPLLIEEESDFEVKVDYLDCSRKKKELGDSEITGNAEAGNRTKKDSNSGIRARKLKSFGITGEIRGGSWKRRENNAKDTKRINDLEDIQIKEECFGMSKKDSIDFLRQRILEDIGIREFSEDLIRQDNLEDSRLMESNIGCEAEDGELTMKCEIEDDLFEFEKEAERVGEHDLNEETQQCNDLLEEHLVETNTTCNSYIDQIPETSQLNILHNIYPMEKEGTTLYLEISPIPLRSERPS